MADRIGLTAKRTSDGRDVAMQIDHRPDACPVCHLGVDAREVYTTMVVRGHVISGELAFQCPRVQCKALFIGYYRRISTAHEFDYERSAPVTPKGQTFSQEITDASPEFVRIYNQALAAEQAQLDAIAGVGFRKALEFLVKDYLISVAPDEATKAAIRKEFLGTCIEQRVHQTNLREVARRAVWLGNDETHYERRWTAHDIEDLKKLVRLTMNWVETELLTALYVQGMPHGGAPGGTPNAP
jgi:hypothetical protein